MKNLISGQVDIEDVAPLLYLKYRLYELDEKIRVKHIVIDEAQDFSLFQFYALKRIDQGQFIYDFGRPGEGIHSYRGLKDWESFLNQVFEGEADLLNLEQGLPDYRGNYGNRHLGDPKTSQQRFNQDQTGNPAWGTGKISRHGR